MNKFNCSKLIDGIYKRLPLQLQFVYDYTWKESSQKTSLIMWGLDDWNKKTQAPDKFLLFEFNYTKDPEGKQFEILFRSYGYANNIKVITNASKYSNIDGLIQTICDDFKVCFTELLHVNNFVD